MLNISSQKISLFLFFSCIYAFLSLWISIVYFFKINVLLIGGILFYIFASLFHIAVIKLTEPYNIKKENNSNITLFFIIMTIFCGVSLAGIYFMQNIAVKYSDIPENIFRIVNWSLTLISFAISFGISFMQKKYVDNSPRLK